MLNERDWRRRNRDRDEEKKKKEKKEFWWENGNDPRTEKESTFYTSPAKDGTIKQKKTEEKAKPDIPTIKDHIETAKTNVDNLTKAHWDTIINGGTDDQIYMAKQDVENAKKEVESLNLQLTEAYGLGPNGYWNNKNPMNKQDRIVHEAGQKPTMAAQSTTTPTVKPKPITRPKTVTELDNWVNNPEGYRPPNATAAVRPKVTAPVTPRKRVTSVPTTHLDMDIAQMQDELAHNPNMSEQKRWGIEDKITKLSADRDVLNWRRSRTTPPTVEDFEAKKGYIEQQKQFNQDAIVNGLGNGTLKVGSDEWYALQKKGDKLQEQIDAYNRGMMGVLDGEKAVTRSEQAEYKERLHGKPSLSAINDPMHVSEDKNKKDDKPNEGESSLLGNIADTVSNVGHWVFDAVTGAAQWMQDNAETVHNPHGTTEQDTNILSSFIDANGNTWNQVVNVVTGVAEWVQDNKEATHDLHGEEEESDFFDSIADTVSNVGQGVVNAVTGGLEWVQDNADAIRDAQHNADAIREEHEKAEREEENRILNTPLDELSLEETEIWFELEETRILNEVDTWCEEKMAIETQKARKHFADLYKGLPQAKKSSLEKQGIYNANDYIDYCFKVHQTEEMINLIVERGRKKKLGEKFHESYIGLMPDDYVRLAEGISLPFHKVEFTNLAQMKVVADTLEYFSNYYSDVSEVTGAGSLATAWYGPLSLSLGLVGFGLSRGSKNYKNAADELRRLMEEGKTATVIFKIGDMEVIGG